MKLDRDIKFKADFIMPICLPEADDKSDILKKKGKHLYVLLHTIDVHKQNNHYTINFSYCHIIFLKLCRSNITSFCRWMGQDRSRLYNK